MKRKVFRSRISVLLAVVIGITLLPPLIPMISSGNIFNPAFYVVVFIVLLFSGFRYEITDEQLRVSTWGTCAWNYPLSKIESVKRSYIPLSAPAASLKRLSIKGAGIFALISPVREQEFLETLKTLNPNIQINVVNRKGWWRFWDWDI